MMRKSARESVVESIRRRQDTNTGMSWWICESQLSTLNSKITNVLLRTGTGMP